MLGLTRKRTRLTLLITVALFGLLFAALAGCAVANRFYVPPALETAELSGAPTRPPQPSIVVTTWNIGYAGMGRDSDFVYDLGQQRRPLNAGLVDANLAGITQTIAGFDSDIILLQEAARPSWVNYRRDVLAGVVGALPGYAHTFGPDVNTRGIPPPWNIQVGNAIFTRIVPLSAERRGLPLEPTFELGLFRRGYRMHILRVDDGRQWVIINIHLSTFDSPEDDVRRQQVVALLAFAEEEYAKGHYVVIGGDWNLRLADNDFPNTTDERFKFWIRDFPQELVPEGWRWAVDPTIPTVRTAYQPYVAGENYVLNIDGFLVSPNVAIADVEGMDLGFLHSDHQPVTARFAMRP
jgi:endonuclease/exonuclease/phosphatase family metal-dependent hydrolase